MSEWQAVDSTAGNANLSNDELRAALADASKLWLAHDGLWFLEWEKRHGMEEAIEADTEAWRVFAKLEARRIMKRLGIEPGGGISALLKCLPHRLYANICRFTMHRRGDNEAKIRMNECRVQDARARKDLPPFPCKSVGIVEFSTFAKTVDRRFEVECVQCPPDEMSPGGWCEWVFTLSE
ncbi:MAG: hypothetical protein KJ970_08780 [Candidatus Eisenbacteria bacterium]|uniref:Cytosolic protein n=1 Tax=Eiseniibacteriota bacterium TaxID=2212470 RepID=A0A948RUZ2_UNCEI|nr:hypothetical protein [Candidatus Eisenbacteria bacterium]MBU1951259.1 hypothetical protein [Candidatus Eisenbacteria bacterium]MBU2691011.1 hypothetical protein [Candidatus Eisenbacteria bacterium]